MDASHTMTSTPTHEPHQQSISNPDAALISIGYLPHKWTPVAPLPVLEGPLFDEDDPTPEATMSVPNRTFDRSLAHPSEPIAVKRFVPLTIDYPIEKPFRSRGTARKASTPSHKPVSVIKTITQIGRSHNKLLSSNSRLKKWKNNNRYLVLKLQQLETAIETELLRGYHSNDMLASLILRIELEQFIKKQQGRFLFKLQSQCIPSKGDLNHQQIFAETVHLMRQCTELYPNETTWTLPKGPNEIVKAAMLKCKDYSLQI